jgi:eukaryotic-like serine/threonine-protein kinase
MSDFRDTALVFDRPADDFGARARVAAALFGSETLDVAIGRFRVEETIGAGAMGTVYAAMDPKLDRRVALKVLHGSATDEERQRERLIREARALARLSHPNVVQVFEVGEAEGAVYIVMELVPGLSLRVWQSTPRSWRQVVETYARAGDGLAAAHEVGVIHRDFKPANVLVGDTGSVKVADFGLALRPGSAPSTRSGSDMYPGTTGTSTRMTRTGAVLGTPAYMAPEQLRGAHVDARADQFSFCVALYEAIFGVRPYSPEQLEHEGSASLSAPQVRVRCPRWLRHVLVQGLQIDPLMRWPTMSSLLEALRRGLARRRRIMAGLLVSGAMLGVATASAMMAVPGCSDPSTRLAKSWNADARARIDSAFEATGAPYQSVGAANTVTRIGEYAEAWSAAHADVCSESRTRRDRSAEYFDLAMACLDRQLTRLEAVINEFEHVDLDAAARAEQILATLQHPTDCQDPERVRSDFMAGDDAPASFTKALLDADLDVAAGRFDAALASIDALSRMERVGASHRADLASVKARALHQLGRIEEARASYVHAIRLAEAARRDRGVLALWNGLVQLTVQDYENLEDAQQWLLLYEGAFMRLGEPGWARGDIEVARGRVDVLASDNPAAKLHFETAIDVYDREAQGAGLEVIVATKELANVLVRAGDSAAADELYASLLEDVRSRFGAEHPEALKIEYDLALSALDSGAPAKALTHLQRALQIGSRIYGDDSLRIGPLLMASSDAALRLGDLVGAREYASRARRLQEALPDAHSERLSALSMLVNIARTSGDQEEELVLNQELLATGLLTSQARVAVESNLAWLACELKQCVGADELLRHAFMSVGADDAIRFYLRLTSARVKFSADEQEAACRIVSELDGDSGLRKELPAEQYGEFVRELEGLRSNCSGYTR